MFEYRATVRRVLDGDTIEVQTDLGFNVFKRDTLRLYGVQAPELPTPEGLAAKQWLTDRLPVSENALRIETFKPKPETFGRYLAIVFAAGANINDELVAAGQAVVWFP